MLAMELAGIVRIQVTPHEQSVELAHEGGCRRASHGFDLQAPTLHRVQILIVDLDFGGQSPEKLLDHGRQRGSPCRAVRFAARDRFRGE
jgi:hypothetical protein